MLIEKPCYVYLAMTSDGRPRSVKIGKTRNLKNRMSQLRHKVPTAFLYAYVEKKNDDDAMRLEKLLHDIGRCGATYKGDWHDMRAPLFCLFRELNGVVIYEN